MDAAAELGRNPVSQHQIQPEYGDEQNASRDQILRHARGQGNINFPCPADHEQDWQPYPVDPYSAIIRDDHTYIHTYIQLIYGTYNGGLLPDSIILMTQGYYHRGTRLNAM